MAWPRARARSTLVRRSMGAFQWMTVRSESTTTSAPGNVSMRLASKSSRRRGIQATIARGYPGAIMSPIMRSPFDPALIVMVILALALSVVAYLRDPGLPWIGARTGFSMLWFILPRLVPALILAGLLQVLVPQEVVLRYFGRQGGLRAL